MMADGGPTPDNGFSPGPDTLRAFRDALGQFATGVTLITIDTPDGPMGFVANSFASLSMDPPLVMWALAKSARRFPHFSQAQHFAIHVLAAGQIDLIDRFTSKGTRFVGLDFSTNPQGVPLLPDALARFECSLNAIHEGGDHLIIVGRVERVTGAAAAPLIFANGRMGGFAPPV